MKILIISDIHGDYKSLNKVVESNKFDKLFILGDVLQGPNTEDYNREEVIKTLKKYKEKISIVKGNCDSEEDFQDLGFTPEKFVEEEIDNMKFVLTHGHLFNYYNLPNVDFDVYIQGHTHIPVLVEMDGKYYVNPGSLSLPKGLYDKSYAIYENNKITIHELNGPKIMEEKIEVEKDN